MEPAAALPRFIKPARLRPGDTIAAISLSSGLAALFPHRFEAGKRQFEQPLGVRVIATGHALRDDAWLRCNPEARADDLHEALSDGNIKGIISTIGGDDSVRILPYLDPDIIRANPKILMASPTPPFRLQPSSMPESLLSTVLHS